MVVCTFLRGGGVGGIVGLYVFGFYWKRDISLYDAPFPQQFIADGGLVGLAYLTLSGLDIEEYFRFGWVGGVDEWFAIEAGVVAVGVVDVGCLDGADGVAIVLDVEVALDVVVGRGEVIEVVVEVAALQVVGVGGGVCVGEMQREEGGEEGEEKEEGQNGWFK